MLSEVSALFFKRFLLFRSLAHSLSSHVTDFELLPLTLGTLEVLIFISMSDKFTFL